LNFFTLAKVPTSNDEREHYRWYYQICEILNGWRPFNFISLKTTPLDVPVAEGTLSWNTTNSTITVGTLAGNKDMASAPSFIPITNANYSITPTTSTVLISTGASNRTVNMSGGVSGQIVVVKKIDAGAGTVSFIGGTSCTIDGSTVITLSTQYEFLGLQCTTVGASSVWSIIQ